MAFQKQVLYLIIVFASFGFLKVDAQYADLDILKSINPQYPTAAYWKNTSSSAYWVSAGISFGTLATGLITNNKKLQSNGYETLISIAISTLVSESLKSTFNRSRPADRYPLEVFVNTPSHGRSFPSGHTTLAFATATSVALQYKKWYVVVPAYAWATSVGYSRMYLGRHLPSEVLGGAVAGIAGGLFSHWLTGKLFKHSIK